jgi:diguanylate cyclase (GGDEF)-like protein
MTARLEAETEPEPVAGLLVDSIAATFGFRRLVALDLRDDLAPAVIVTHGLRTADGPAAADGQGALLAALERTREPQLVAGLDPAADAWLAGLIPGARNLVAMPLVADSRILGAILAEHRTSRIERETLGMLERFTSHGALALANAWLLERVRRLADTDGLTGVANRRTFDATLAREIARAARGQDDLSLVMLDVDRFKQLNDTYGHQTGDDVLKRVAAALEGCMRSFDTVARYGGEEFAVLLPRASAADAVSVAERLRRAIARSSTDPAVTVSAGVATFPLDAAAPADLVAAADAALYASKAAGRDCVTAASDVKRPARRRRPAGAAPAKRRAKPKA